MYTKDYQNVQGQKGNVKIPVENFDAGPALEEFARRTGMNNNSFCNQNIPEESCRSHSDCHLEKAPDKDCTPECVENKLCHENCHSRDINCTQKSCNSKKFLSGLGADDLLILLLILLLIGDCNDMGDYMIPILLAVLLIG